MNRGLCLLWVWLVACHPTPASQTPSNASAETVEVTSPERILSPQPPAELPEARAVFTQVDGENFVSAAEGVRASDYLAMAMGTPDGASPVSELMRGTFPEGTAPLLFDVEVTAGRCYVIAAQGGLHTDSVQLDLVRLSDLSLLEEGTQRDLQSTLGTSRSLCPAEDTTYMVRLRLRINGASEIALQAFAFD